MSSLATLRPHLPHVLASWLVPLVGPVAAIKLINLPFIAILSFAIYQIVLVSSGSRRRAATAGALVCVAPTPLVNAFAWGQADCIFTSFLALFVLFAIKRAPVAAAAMFGASLAFKPQGIFLLPLLLYLILAKQMKIWHLVLLPMMYLVMMVPAAIAGRPWLDLVTVYVGPFQELSKLAIDAANLWRIVGRLELVDDRTGLLIGCAAAGLAGAAIAISALRLQPGPRTIVLVAALSSALMPYLLPKMHDRYFFVADIMTLTVAFVIPRVWVTVPLLQVGSLLSYLPYFGLSGRASVYAVVPVTLGVSILAMDMSVSRRKAGSACRSFATAAEKHPDLQRATAGTIFTDIGALSDGRANLRSANTVRRSSFVRFAPAGHHSGNFRPGSSNPVGPYSDVVRVSEPTPRCARTVTLPSPVHELLKRHDLPCSSLLGSTSCCTWYGP